MIRNLFHRNRSSLEIRRALGLLLTHQLAHYRTTHTAGRPEERWFYGPDPTPKTP